MNVILFCGSRHLIETRELVSDINEILYRLPRGSVVLHGAARGLDSIAAKVSETFRNSISVIAMPAPWDLHGTKAGPMRNIAMLGVMQALQRCGYEAAVHAFPLAGFNNVGTRHTIGLATKADVSLFVHEIHQ